MHIGTKTFISILFISGFGAFFQLLGMGAIPQKVILFGSIVSLVLFCEIKIHSTFLRPLLVLSLYFMYSFVSSFIFFDSIAKAIFSTQGLIYCFVYFLFGACYDFKPSKYSAFLNAFVIFLSIQFFALAYKFLRFGVDEADWLGTLAHGTGQLSILFPLICIPIVVSLFRDKIEYLVPIIIVVFMFGIIGEKRATFFLMPPFILYCLYRFNKRGFLNFFLSKKNILIAALAVIFATVSLMTIPSLNKEASETFGGSVSFIFALKYAVEYLTMDYGGTLQAAQKFAATDKGIQLGRLTIWAFIFNWFSQADLLTQLFGMGYGGITQSIWLHTSNDVMFDALGARGALCGANLALVEGGIVGLLLQSYFLFLSFKIIKRWRSISKKETVKNYFLILELIFLIFFFDYFFYSTVLFNALPLPIILFTGLGFCSSVIKRGEKVGHSRT